MKAMNSVNHEDGELGKAARRSHWFKGSFNVHTDEHYRGFEAWGDDVTSIDFPSNFCTGLLHTFDEICKRGSENI